MSQAADPHAEVTKFVKDDPYVKSNLVKDYSIREFSMTDKQTDFDRIAQKFLLRSWAIMDYKETRACPIDVPKETQT